MSSKRSPQTAAKRDREQAVREKRERKALKKQAAILAKLEPPVVEDDGTELDPEGDVSEETAAADDSVPSSNGSSL
ncbi:MAG TPA: hypothetical protein VGM80_01315 [Gaiellaceae bacterium]